MFNKVIWRKLSTEEKVYIANKCDERLKKYFGD